ncbi:MAG TPA: LytTR family DNA-binding domain-containing protein [Woeseiaceae bacterium]|nr:LytTR family DNA-binding domain-containing protein [Woeseiaceae bacterium]
MRILIVDDEKPARDRLRQLVDDLGGHDVVGEAGNGEEALALATELNPDVVLLDIRMPGMDGIETAHHLNAMREPPAVVFATAYNEYAIDAFDARAIGYVLKPVRRERLERALEHAQRLAASALAELSSDPDMASRRRHVCARVKGELRLIPIGQVRCFVADQKYTNVHHQGGQNLIDDSLKSLEEEFAEEFVRIHRGALVRVSEIDKLEKQADGKTRVVLRAGSKDTTDTLIISRRHVADVKRRLRGG